MAGQAGVQFGAHGVGKRQQLIRTNGIPNLLDKLKPLAHRQGHDLFDKGRTHFLQSGTGSLKLKPWFPAIVERVEYADRADKGPCETVRG